MAMETLERTGPLKATDRSRVFQPRITWQALASSEEVCGASGKSGNVGT
jgi:hypothetical protein